MSQGQSVVCTITNTRKAHVATVKPVLECVVFRGGAPDRADWGYQNDNGFAVTIPIGADNQFTPGQDDRGQPDVFQPGRVVGLFQTPFGGNSTLTWKLAGQTVTADRSSPRCTATIELRKATVPADDPGTFNLLLNGRVVATGGNGTTTGPMIVGVGEGTVSETGAARTDLGDYDSRIDCTRSGKPCAEGRRHEGRRRDRQGRRGRMHVHEHTEVRASDHATDDAADHATDDATDDAADHATDDATDHATDDATDDATDHATDHAPDHAPDHCPRPRPRPLRSLRPLHRIRLPRRSAISL